MTFAIVLDADLAPGLAANAAAVLAMSLGKIFPECVGDDIPDRDGRVHAGITAVPIPVLGLEAAAIGRLREAAGAIRELTLVDFTHTARAARDYRSYADDLAEAGESDLRYVGIALAGERTEIKRLTGALPLFR